VSSELVNVDGPNRRSTLACTNGWRHIGDGELPGAWGQRIMEKNMRCINRRVLAAIAAIGFCTGGISAMSIHASASEVNPNTFTDSTRSAPDMNNIGVPAYVVPETKLLHFDSPIRIPNQYLVKFKDDDSLAKIPLDGYRSIKIAPSLLPNTVDNIRSLVKLMRENYRKKEGTENTIMGIWTRPRARGFAIKNISENDVAELARDARIEFIEPNMYARPVTVQIQNSGAPGCSGNACAPWHLDRVDQPTGLDGLYHYQATGQNVMVDVIDSGLYLPHSEFSNKGLAFEENSSAYDCTNNVTGCVQPGMGSTNAVYDCYGHGTAVASVILGNTFGVAKGASVSGLGTASDCTSSLGADAITNALSYADYQKISTGQGLFGVVVNMSFQFGGVNTMVDAAVNQLIDDGVTVVVAAGNDGSATNACNFTPSDNSRAIRVGATDTTDTRRSDSNYGACVDIFAPGTNVYSADDGGTLFTGSCATAYPNTVKNCPLGQTSLAAPIITGIAALYLEDNPTADAVTVKNVILANATQNVVKNAGTGSPNLFAYIGVPGNVVGSGGGGVTPSILVISIINNLLL
jgi:hypothetical protein